jgi:hypothetical protein
MCNHWWICESQNGEKSQSYCKLCGEKKEFLNAFPMGTFLNPHSLVSPKVPRPRDNDIDMILVAPKTRQKSLERILDNALK